MASGKMVGVGEIVTREEYAIRQRNVLQKILANPNKRCIRNFSNIQECNQNVGKPNIVNGSKCSLCEKTGRM